MKNTSGHRPGVFELGMTQLNLLQPEFADPQFAKIEELLQGRNYKHYRRNNTDYIRLGTTGGMWHHQGPGNTDHVTLVTVTEDGPQIANIRLDGMFDKNGPADPGTEGPTATSEK